MNALRGCSLYRFVNDGALTRKIQEWGPKYGFGQINVLAGNDFYPLLNRVIDTCPDDYALVSCNDLTWPIGLEFALDGAIDAANAEFGPNNWGVLGNCGIEFFSNKPLCYIRDNDLSVVPASSGRSRVATYLDRNTLLLNIANLRRRGVRLPAGLRGVFLYSFVLVMECYRKGLISAVDSHLFVLDLTKYDYEQFEKERSGADFTGYIRGTFVNRVLATTRGDIGIENDIGHLVNPAADTRADYYGLVDSLVCETCASKGNKTVTIVTRTMLNRINFLYRLLDSIRMATLFGGGGIALKVILAVNNARADTLEENLESISARYPDLSITVSNFEDNGHYPRVSAMKSAVNLIEDDSSFVWFVDDDDFIYPESIRHLPVFLSKETVFVGDSAIMDETWENGRTFPSKSKKVGVYESGLHHECVLGDNKIPVCSVIYPVTVLREIFGRFRLLGDYNEDYTLFLAASCSRDVAAYPVLIAGISMHGSNTTEEEDKTHWHHSYAAFVSELVEKKVMPEWVYRLIQEKSLEIDDLKAKLDGRNGPSQKKRWWGRRLEQTIRRYRKSLVQRIKERFGRV